MSRNLIALQNKFLGHGETVYDRLARLRADQGYIDDADIERLAAELHLPPQQLRATAKFYDRLAIDAPAKHELLICNGEACRSAGMDAVSSRLHRALGVGGPGETSHGGVRVGHVTCLGYCGLGPNAMLDGRPLSLAADGAVDTLAAELATGRSVSLPEPVNAIHLPENGASCVLLRHFHRDVVPIGKARAAGVYWALEHRLTSSTPEEFIAELKASELRGRGGAGFSTGVKYETVRRAHSADGKRYVVVNADEGDAGAYIDKELMERDPHTQLEGALLAAWACGASEAIVYIRFEYPRAIAVMRRAVEEAREAGLIGRELFGTGFSCEVRVVEGQGAYICGEETSLLRSLEGVPALVSFKPPYPAEKGLRGRPTAVNNVETIHNLPWIAEHGGKVWAGNGEGRSRGTKLVSLNSRVARPGLYEVELGITLRELIFDLAGGMAGGARFKAVQVGGPLGGIFPERLLDTRLTFEDMDAAGGLLGHGGVVVYAGDDDLIEIGRHLMEFCAVESCGKCFPCRIGSVRGVELFDQFLDDGVTDERLGLLRELCDTMEAGSLCALGGLIPLPIRNLMDFFPEEFDRYRRRRYANA